MINQKWKIEPNQNKGGVNKFFLLYLGYAQKEWGVHINEDVTNDIYFMYNYFFENRLGPK